jgi:hypothetical protein|tara:strand:- start:120 stop:254 length:135 start_codon:yes stop_codon:yes gene_type:complete
MEVLRFVDGRSMLISGALERKGFHHGVGRARGQRKSMEILPKTE